MIKKHWAIFIDNTSEKGELFHSLLNGNPPEHFDSLKGLKGALVSRSVLDQFIEEEDRHDTKVLTVNKQQSLKSMSSGEQKKALLNYLLETSPDFIIVDNPFDNLDSEAQADLHKKLALISQKSHIVQFLSRKDDLLPFTNIFAKLQDSKLTFYNSKNNLINEPESDSFTDTVPKPLKTFKIENDILIRLEDVNVTYGNRPILRNINWTIKKGEFWELRGKNGSGKTTILAMITGENPKGYGQQLYIFGRKKGTGESVWDIKRRIGYFTPSMTDKFTGYHSVGHMIISGLTDSIGLYTQPTESQIRLAHEWIRLIGLVHLKNALFHDLTMGQRRLVMCARAMIKHPPLLILDEPTAGLDDVSARLLVGLVNKFSQESDTAIIFVSHRKEPDLEPDQVYQLNISREGSIGEKQ